MKKSIVALSVLLLTGAVHAREDGVLSFRISFTTPVLDTDAETKLDHRFVAQIYAGPSSNNLSAAGSPVQFGVFLGRTNANVNGLIFNGPLVTVTNVAEGEAGFYQIRAWEGVHASYEEAEAADGKIGRSEIVGVVFGSSASAPPTDGLASFHLTGGPPPTVQAVIEPVAGVYLYRHPMTFEVTFSDGIRLTGSPQLALTIGTETVNAEFVETNGSTGLIFRHVVRGQDIDPDGISIDALNLNGATIKSPGGPDAVVTFTAVNATNVVVEGSRSPSLGLEAYLKSLTPDISQQFGYELDISGDTLVVGAPLEVGVSGDTPLRTGAVYVYVRESNWVHQAVLRAPGPEAIDRFGTSVGISGDTIVVGAMWEDGSANTVNGPPDELTEDSGAAYVYVREGTNWTLQAYLKPSNPGAFDLFGFTVAIDGDTIVVGASQEDGSANAINGPRDDAKSDTGAAYVFFRSGTNWTEQAYLKPAYPDTLDQFGTTVDISGDTVVVGAAGDDGSANTVNGDHDNDTSSAGAAYVFVRSGMTWSQQAYLKPHNSGNLDGFGIRVAISGDSIIVGSQGEDGASLTDPGDAGAAYVFVRDGTDWSQQAYLRANDPRSSDVLGWGMDIDGDRAIVGAWGDSGSVPVVDGPNGGQLRSSGAAYVFERNGTNWHQLSRLKAPNPAEVDNLGFGVAISPDYIVAGAINETGSAAGVNGPINRDGVKSGAVYSFAPLPPRAAIVRVEPPAAGNYLAGDALQFTVHFSRPVFVTTNAPGGADGTPQLNLRLGSRLVAASYVSGGGTTNLVFSYTVRQRDVDVDGIAVTSPLDLNGGGIKDADSNDAIFAFTEPAAPGVVVSGLGEPLLAVEAYLKAANSERSDFLGWTVAISGNTAVVGARNEDGSATSINGMSDESATDAGAAYVFVRDAAGWSQQAYLKASDTERIDGFGTAVAIAGDTVVVGAPIKESERGAAYVFVRSGSNWTQQASLRADHRDITDNFGEVLAISGDTIVVGAPGEDGSVGGVDGAHDNALDGAGAAYVFVRNGTTWSQQAYLKPQSPGEGNAFGSAVAVAGDWVAVGSPFDSRQGTFAGAVHMFHRNQAMWTELDDLTAGNAGEFDEFGETLAMTENTLVVGAPLEDGNATTVNGADNDSASSAGAAYVFVLAGDSWRQQAYLKAHNAGGDDRFGASLAIQGDSIVVGATREDGAATVVDGSDAAFLENAGAAYLFVRNGTNWTQQAYLKANNTDSGDAFGRSVGVAGNLVIVGASNEAGSANMINGPDDNGAPGSGAAYVFTPMAPGVGITQVSTPTNGSYRAGDQLSFTLRFNTEVTVAGTPLLPLAIGSSNVNAAFFSGSGGTNLVFSYTIQAGQNDGDGIALVSPLALDGGSITNGLEFETALTFAPPDTSGIKVDTVAPMVSISQPSLAATTNTSVSFTIDYTDADLAALTLGSTNISLNRTGTANGSAVVTGDGMSQRTVTITNITGGGALGISIDAGTAVDRAGNTAPGAGPSATFTVIPPNSPPTIANSIGPLDAREDAADISTNLAGVFDDAETAPSDLIYTITSNTNSGLVTASIVNSTNLNLAFAADASGTSEITVRATDPGALFVEDTFPVSVNPVNDAPGFAIPAGTPAGEEWNPLTGAPGVNRLAISADGSRIIGASQNQQLQISTNSGVSWMPRESSRRWFDVASSADGMRLAAAAILGQIYTSADGGVSWIPRETNRIWTVIASSADGATLIAAGQFERLYVSTNFGVNWIPRESARNWTSLAVSADGERMAAAASGGRIYTSEDKGATWIAREDSRGWQSVALSADGTGLAAAGVDTQILVSTDFGVTWTPREAVRNWAGVAMSGDGRKLVAVASGEPIYVSNDSGTTWQTRETVQVWRSPVISADGNMMLVPEPPSGKLFVSRAVPFELEVNEDGGPQAANGFASHISPGPADESAQRVSFKVSNAAAGLFSAQPALDGAGRLTFTPAANANGSATVTVSAMDDGGTANGGVDTSADQSFTIAINAVNDQPSATYATNNVVVLEDAGAQAIASFASFNAGPTNESSQTPTYALTADNVALFASQPTIDVTGTLTFTPTSDANGSATVTVVAQDGGGVANGGVDRNTNTFRITVTAVNDAPSFAIPIGVPAGDSWAFRIGAPPMRQMAMSADGMIVAGVFRDIDTPIHISIDSGMTWTAHETARPWSAVAMSADGTKLAAAVHEGQIYTSTDSGLNWTPRENNRRWSDLASSADGTRLAAVVRGGQIYTSDNAGVDWIPRETNRNWTSVATSADGAKLVATVASGQIHTSADSGASWVARETNRQWTSVASSADGRRLVAVASQDKIYTSIDSGQTWTARETDRFWTDVASSADGRKLVATSFIDGHICVSRDGGLTWTERRSGLDWEGVASSADGSRLIASNPALGAPAVSIAEPFVVVVAEDGGAQATNGFATGISPGPTDEAGQTVTFAVTNDSNSLFSVQPAIDSDGRFTYTPAADANGRATITITAADDGGTANAGMDTSAPQIFEINVNAVNDQPVATHAKSEVAALEDAGAQSLAGFTSFNPGPVNELTQGPTYILSNDNSPLFSSQPSIDATGRLGYTPTADANGTALITVIVQDSGGATNGGVDKNTNTFQITVTSVNDQPSATHATNNVVVLEDAGAQSLAGFADFDPGAADEQAQIPTYALTNNNPALFAVQPVIAADGTLTFTTVTNGNGDAIVTVVVRDSGGIDNNGVDKNTNSFQIRVTPVNDAPFADNNSYQMDQSDVLTVPAAGVLMGDTDVENSPLTAVPVDGVAQGRLNLLSTGGFTYTPDTNFWGDDRFTYRANDGDLDSAAAATAAIHVFARPFNSVPGSQTVFANESLRFSATNTPDPNGITVGDPDSVNLWLSIFVTNGAVAVLMTNGVTVSNAVPTTNGMASSNLFLSGAVADLTNALASLSYLADFDFFGEDTLHLISTDEGGRTNRGNTTVPILVEIPTLGGIPKVSLESLNNTNTGVMVTNVTPVMFDTNLIEGVVFDSVSNVVNVLPGQGQDGSTNRSEVTVMAQLSDGTTRLITVPVIIYQPLLTSVSTNDSATYNSTFNTPIFNPQTSLYEQKVSVENNTPFDFTALRITATNLPVGVILQNATVTNGGRPFIDYNLAVPSGGNVTLRLEYFSPDLMNFTPGLRLELLNETRVTARPANVDMTAIAPRSGYTPDGLTKNYLQFPTEAGRLYYIEYQDAVGPGWKISPVVITGTGLIMNWLDDGPPGTETPPGANRFYRVVTER